MFESITFYQSFEDLHVSIPSGHHLLLIGEKTPLSSHFFHQHPACVGAIFPHILFGEQSYEEGIIALKLASSTHLDVLNMQQLDAFELPKSAHAVLTFVSTYSSHIDTFLDTLYAQLPAKAKLIGGVAKALVWHTDETLKLENVQRESALILSSSSTIGLGVKHGWKTLISPFIANACKGKRVEKINFQDAFLAYKEAIESHTKLRFHSTPFEKIAQQHPFGIVRYKKDFIIREPLSTEGNAIVLAGSLDENSVLAILQGNKDELIEAAKEAAQNALNNFSGELPSSVLLISCYSRFLFLDEAFQEELHAIHALYPAHIPLWGVLSLGELANDNQEGIALYNNTCVIGVLG